MTPTTTPRLGETIFSPNLGADLILVGLTYPATATDAELEARTIRPDVMRLSADGRGWIDGWHRGEETGEPVYVEKRTTGGSNFHGWIDGESRRIVQAG